jgi:glycosyltransferase involved in cell wall biosynthesis
MAKVSVVIPTYNREEIIDRAIKSALRQTIDEVEVIVVDDGSDDNTASVVSAYDEVVFIQHETNKGGSAARNTGIEAATGEYIAFLDSDDSWLPTKLEQQVSMLERRDREWIAAYCDFHQTRSNVIIEWIDNRARRPTGLEGGEELIREIFLRQFAHGGSSTLLVKQSAISRIGGFDPTFQRFQDLEFLIRLLQVGKMGFVNKKLVYKHDTGNPTQELAEQSYTQFVNKFSSEIEEREIMRNVEKIHQFMMSKYYLSEGNIWKGIQSVHAGECPHYRYAMGVVLSFVRGIFK